MTTSEEGAALSVKLGWWISWYNDKVGIEMKVSRYRIPAVREVLRDGFMNELRKKCGLNATLLFKRQNEKLI
jgi:hypothetical protein